MPRLDVRPPRRHARSRSANNDSAAGNSITANANAKARAHQITGRRSTGPIALTSTAPAPSQLNTRTRCTLSLAQCPAVRRMAISPRLVPRTGQHGAPRSRALNCSQPSNQVASNRDGHTDQRQHRPPAAPGGGSHGDRPSGPRAGASSTGASANSAISTPTAHSLRPPRSAQQRR